MLRLKTILGTALLLPLLAAQASAQVVCEGLTAQHPLTYRSPTYGYSLAYPASMEIVPDSISERGDTVRFEAPRLAGHRQHHHAAEQPRRNPVPTSTRSPAGHHPKQPRLRSPTRGMERRGSSSVGTSSTASTTSEPC